MKRSRIRPKGTPDPVWLEARAATIYRAHGRCERCRGNDGSEVHHRQGRRIANPHALANLVLLCAGCHRFVHSYPTESYLTGWLVHHNGVDEPCEVPLTDRRGRTFSLTNDGDLIPLYR